MFSGHEHQRTGEGRPDRGAGCAGGSEQFDQRAQKQQQEQETDADGQNHALHQLLVRAPERFHPLCGAEIGQAWNDDGHR